MRIITVASRPPVRLLGLAALVVWGLVGCAQRQGCRIGNEAVIHEISNDSDLDALPSAPRDHWALRPDVLKLLGGIDLGNPARRVAGARSGREYRQLLAESCQCRAASSSTLGNLLQAESRLAYQNAPHHGKLSRVALIEAELLALRSIDQRNQDAAAALILFYRLAEAEAGLDALERSSALVGEALGHVAKLRESGLRIDVDPLRLERQKLDLLDRTAALGQTAEQLNSQLGVLLGDDDHPNLAYWPAAELIVDTTPLDIDEAITIGLASRGDLAILRRLREGLDQETLPAARGGLRQTDPMLGLPPAGGAIQNRMLRRILARRGSELSVRREQFAQLQADRQRLARFEIRQHVRHIRVTITHIVIAKELLENRIKRLDQLREQQATGAATPFGLIAAKIEIEKAQANLIEKIVAWEIARVDLAKSQGILAAQCGFSISSLRDDSGCCW